MTKTICGNCGCPKDAHTTYGWNNCQTEISKRNSSKGIPRGIL